MVKFDNDTSRAVRLCIKKGVPFCLYALPGCDDTEFFANPSYPLSDGSEGNHLSTTFFIGDWMASSSHYLSIHKEKNAREIIDMVREWPEQKLPSADNFFISHQQYLETLRKVITQIKSENLGKVVISRAISLPGVDAECCMDLLPVIFNAFPRSFRHISFTPETGCWLGATPEIILECTKNTGTVTTMSLAATRPLSEQGNIWDSKDIEEQRIVTRYIHDALERKGLDVLLSDPFTLTTGDLQHICTIIEAKPVTEFFGLLDLLNPTPAICGFPKDKASEIIANVELHDRRCYGGVVGVNDIKTLHAFVNLRCININEERSCGYAGGGILPDSIPEKEWEETQRKIQSIARFLPESPKCNCK